MGSTRVLLKGSRRARGFGVLDFRFWGFWILGFWGFGHS